MTSETRNHLRELWEQIDIRPPVQSAFHLHAGPYGAWLSVSLETPDDPPAWLYFRMSGGSLQCTRADDALPAVELQWEDAGDDAAVRTLMQEFAEHFAISRAPAIECASPPCSMPPEMAA